MDRAEASLLWLWMAAPFAGVILRDSVLFDGARQLLFALPPLFVLSSVAFEVLFQKTRPALWAGLLGVALAPGVYSIIQLHPYEYVYYNDLVGGVSGAERRFELDYWLTSYREAIEKVNEIAPENSSVTLVGTIHTALPFARPDLSLTRVQAMTGRPDYAVVTTRTNLDQAIRNAPLAPTVFEIQRAGALLAVVRELRSPLP